MNISKVGRWLGKQAKFLVAVALAAVIGGATTAGVMAAIPDSDGTIHACYTTGLLARVKIIDSASQSCGSNEAAINWKQNGSPLLANPAGKNLSEAVMIYWDLRNIDFTGTNLHVAKLISSDLRGSNLSNAAPTAALMMDSDLRGANLTNTNFSVATLERANLSNQAFSGTSFYGAYLRDANLTGTSFNNVDMRMAVLENQNLSGKDLSTTNLESANFNNTTLDGVILSSSPLLTGMQLIDSSLKNIDFNSANLAGSNLTGADLSGSDVSNIIWVHPDYSSATCPDGTLASDHSDTCIGHL